jgi:hypothetical protein
MRVNPKGAQSAGSCPSSLSSSRSSVAFSDLCRALRAAPTFSGSISVNGLPQCGVEAQHRGTRLPPNRCREWSEAIRQNIEALGLVIRVSGLVRLV